MNILYKTTSSCNANCSYCFDKINQDNKTQLMPLPQLHQIFEHLCCMDDYISWTWHGGEPTLAGQQYLEDAMFDMTMLAMQYNVQIDFGIQSNGILFDKSWYDLFDKYSVQVGMSWDGINNLQSRRYSHTPPIGSMGSLYIITPNNIDNLIEDYKFANKHNLQVSRNWVFPNDGQTVEDIWGDPNVPIQKYLKFLQFYIWDANGQTQDRNINGWILQSLGKHSDTCLFGNCWDTDLFCLDYHGKIYKCDELHRPELLIGDILNFNSIEELKQSKTVQTQLQKKEKWKKTDCKDCPYLGLCFQGCYTRAIQESKGEHPYSFGCLLTKTILPFLYEQISNLAPEQFIKLNPVIKDLLISNNYVPAFIKERTNL